MEQQYSDSPSSSSGLFDQSKSTTIPASSTSTTTTAPHQQIDCSISATPPTLPLPSPSRYVYHPAGNDRSASHTVALPVSELPATAPIAPTTSSCTSTSCTAIPAVARDLGDSPEALQLDATDNNTATTTTTTAAGTQQQQPHRYHPYSTQRSGSTTHSTLSNKPSTGKKSKTRTRAEWSIEEEEQFLQGLEFYGPNCALIAKVVPTRTVDQVRTHWKYLQRVFGEGCCCCCCCCEGCGHH
jgi:hypothetical protein